MSQFRNLILLSVFFVLSVSAQITSDEHAKLRNSLTAHDYRAVCDKLKSASKKDAVFFAANNYTYMLAYSCEKSGDAATAMKYFQKVVSQNSVLNEYALWHLAKAARESGNLLLEKFYLQRLLAEFPSSLIARAAEKRLVRSNLESENFRVVIAALNQTEGLQENSQVATSGISREDSVLLGIAFEKNNEIPKAREVFQKLIDETANPDMPDDFALAATFELDKMDVGANNLGKKVANLPEETHLERARIYQFNRNFAFARLHFLAVVERFPQSENRAGVYYEIGRGFGQVRDYKAAAEWFEKVVSQYPENGFAKDSLYQAAGAYANLDQTSEAVSRYRRYIDENPRAANIERSYLNIIDAYRDSGDIENALKSCSAMQRAFPGALGETLAVFARVKINMAQKNWRAALNDLEVLNTKSDFGGMRIAGGTNKTEVEFLRGLMNEYLGEYATAIEIYLSIPDGIREFYGWRATERIRALRNNRNAINALNVKFTALSEGANSLLTSKSASEVKNAAISAYRIAPNQNLLDRIKRAYELIEQYSKLPNDGTENYGRKSSVSNQVKFTVEDRHKTIANELLFLGIYDEGTPELERALRTENNADSFAKLPATTQHTLALYYQKGDIANRTIQYFEPKWRQMPADFLIELIPAETIQMLYPKPFTSSLNYYGNAEKVDPRFLLSIMRQESRYQADVKSAAAARGLMQFISTTSRKMAEEMNVKGFIQDDLYNPPTAIRFGAHYIANIYREFPNQSTAVAASYNGGEDRMARWLKRAQTNDPDQYTSEIVFAQTKDYAYKVMANYRVYSYLYDSKLNKLAN
ncbi:MAG: transglycosylase SLT domain-containing protein [Pyrinomonadaceae bacterium]